MAGTFNIVAFDGGGIRGLVSALLLQQIQAKYPNALSSVNLFAGTSTGSFMALGLAYGLADKSITPDTLVSLYENDGATIFTPYPTSSSAAASYAARHGASAAADGSWLPSNTFNPKYTNGPLQTLLEQTFPNSTTLADLTTAQKPYALVNTLALDVSRTVDGVAVESWYPVALSNLPNLDAYAGITLAEAALCSGAAPTYFPPFAPTSVSLGYCADGGLFANNPSMQALAGVLGSGLLEQQGMTIADVRMLSLNTGLVESFWPAGQEPNPPVGSINFIGAGLFGILEWMGPQFGANTPSIPMMSAMFDAGSYSATFQAQSILGPNYQRTQTGPLLTTPYPLDDYQDIATLENAVTSYIAGDEWSQILDWVGTNFTPSSSSADRVQVPGIVGEQQGAASS